MDLKDLISPMLVFIGLLLNALWFNRRLEHYRAILAVETDSLKDTQKNRREGLFRLRNSSSLALSAARAILDANEHPNKARLVEALLPSLSRFWTCIKEINSELSNNYLDKEDVRPYSALKGVLLEYFFMLDNTKLGKPPYIEGLRMKLDQIARAEAALREHNMERLKVGLQG